MQGYIIKAIEENLGRDARHMLSLTARRRRNDEIVMEDHGVPVLVLDKDLKPVYQARHLKSLNSIFKKRFMAFRDSYTKRNKGVAKEINNALQAFLNSHNILPLSVGNSNFFIKYKER